MNRVFRIVWSTAVGAWVVASEFAGQHGKGHGRSAALTDQRPGLRGAASGRLLALAVLAALAGMHAPVASSADRYWDVNGGSAGSGGTGTWDTSTAFFNSASDGVAGPFVKWNNAALDNAVFAGTAGTVTLSGGITAQALTFSTTGYELDGGTLTLAGATPTVNVATGNATINSVIAGTAGLTKTGSGSLTLGGANTFSGGINVQSAGLVVTGDSALGAASNGITMASGTALSATTSALAATRTVTTTGTGDVTLRGIVGSARYTGTAGIVAVSGVIMSNAANDYTGRTAFIGGGGGYGFTSIANLGLASSLGAPTDPTTGMIVVQAGGGLGGTVTYSGSGDTSNRAWQFQNTSSGGTTLRNTGTGTLHLTGDIAAVNQWVLAMGFQAVNADIDLSGVLSSASDRVFAYSGSAGRTISVTGANTYTGSTQINTITVAANTLADTGTASSFGTGTASGAVVALINGTLSYTGGAASSNRAWTFDGTSALNNNSTTGGMSLSGNAAFVAGGTDTVSLGGSYTGANTFSGIISGVGNVTMNGAGTWVLGGANTYTGKTTVTAGTLVAGTDQAFAGTSGLQVDGGTLDLNNQSITAPSLAGAGGTVALGSGTLTLKSSTGTSAYSGVITGTGGVTKLGASTATLSGANTYTGATTIGGGTLALDFTVAGAPASNIINAASALNLNGGTLSLKGRAGANAQAFSALNINAGSNRISATAGSGGTLNVALGGINRTGGLIDFAYNTGATLGTTHADGVLGGWATVNGTDYAQVTGGVIGAFTNYANKDDASQWLSGDIVSDEGGAANTPYTNTVNGNVALGGLKYTAAANSTVTVGTGNTLGVDGSIIVAPSAGAASQKIQGGSMTGGAGGSPLGVLQNSTGTFTIASSIVDNGGATSFAAGGSGTGTVALTGNNTYTGGTTVSGGTLAFNSVANGGAASALGASTADAANLVLENGTLRYTGATASTDRGFTLVNGGPARTIQVDGTTNLTFAGQVTSPDDAGFTKTGTGTLTLANGANDFVGPVVVTAGLVATGTLADGGQASGIGAGSSNAASLVLQGGGGLEYTGATASTDRGFTLAGGNGVVAVDDAATTLTDSGTIVGTGRLNKDGAGVLVLSGANTYTGGNTVLAGTLRAGSSQAFGGSATGAGAGTMTVNPGATLDLADFNVWVAGLNGSGNVTLGSGTLQSNGNGTFSGAISGTGGVLISAHTQTMSGCGNTYTGVTTLASASLTTDCLANGGQASGLGASSSASSNVLLQSGTIVYTGTDVAIDRGMQITAAGGINVSNASTTLGIGGLITGTGQFQKLGQGTLVLSGANTYSGGTYVRGGTLRANVVNALSTGALRFDDVAGAALDMNGFDTAVAVVTGGGTTGGNISLGGATLTTNGASSAGVGMYSGAITGNGNIVKTTGSVQYLAGTASTYVGTTTVNAGTLSVQSLANGGVASSLGAASSAAANIVLNGGTLQYLGTGDSTDRLFTLGASASSALGAEGTGAIQFTNTGAVAFATQNTAQTVTLTGASTADNSLAANLADNGTGKTSLRKTGIGTWILRNPASTYTGATTIVGGVLGVDKLTNGGQASSIGASTNAAANLVIGSGATLRYTGAGDTTDRLFTLSTGSSVIESSGTGAIVFSNTGSAAYAGSGDRTLGLGGNNTGNNTMGGSIINGPGGVTTLAKNDAGTWLLTGNNTYTGNTVINGGTLQIGNGGTTGSIASPSVIVAAGTLAFNRSDALNLAGTISGAGNVLQKGTGTTLLTATNTYTGGTSITGGTLQLGNGGASGSIVGDVLDNGTLAFNRSDAYGFAGLVSGTGGVTQRGSGTTKLTGANNYKGATSVEAGTLLIDGNQAGATGTATVQTGGTLGGTGVLGGDVVVATGGSLAPGDSGAAGTLTINGSLSVANGAALNYQFGQADVVGGSLNDLTVVHGNLALDGTLNVAATPGGSFGPGLYRIISYDGTLNDQGLALGTTPSGSYQVQTSVAHQVNLLNGSGLTLNFWDGPAGHANHTIDGGSGTWQDSSGNDNWADQTGAYNAPYTDGEFAIFMGAPGTVTVDNTLGNVTSAGMQFAVDGYRINGDAITLTGGPSVFRVGDGTAAGAAMTANIDATLAGTGGLEKEDLGTLVLSGANTYTGGTAVNAGTLSISGDANLGDAAGNLSIDGATLRTTGTMTSARAVTVNQGGATLDTLADLGLTGVVDGAGTLTKTGSGTLTLAGNNSYAGGTVIDGGTVAVAADANLGNTAGALTLDGGTLQNSATFASARGVSLGAGGGTFDTLGDLSLAGTISGAGSLAKAGNGALILTAENNYTGGTVLGSGVLQLGNGGTTGSVAGDIVDNGTLVFNRSNTLTLAGLISGAGSVEQRGAGITILTGANRYAGSTAVRGGALFVNGDQSLATGSTTVDAGGTLGGKGTIGGDVVIADNGTLNAGDVGSAPGTLSIRGDLTLNGASNLNVDLGQANVVGGPLNDLTKVNGDLTLDGVLNVSVSSGGTFDPGIYRIIGYNGSLTDNGLAIGSVPSPNYFLQTSVAQQVNLVNTNGLPVNMWDGNGNRGDGVVSGGDGVWQNASGNDNWTLLDGSINAPFQDSSFAIFAAAPGTVTVDASLGAINTAGMQFATDGYRVEGDSIALTGSSPVIRVGDGTTDGATMTATIASQLTGTNGLTKSDLGTLVLTGANTYTGNTSITGGTLQLGEGGTSGSIVGDVANDGTLAFDRSDDVTFDGLISGTGAVAQRGSGTTVLTGSNRYSGPTTVQAGTLLINGDASLATGTTTVQAGAVLGGAGTLGGDVTVDDGGTLSPGPIAGSAGTLTINGSLALGANSMLDYQLGQAGTPGGALNDLTVVHGNLTLGGTLNVTTTAGGAFGAGVYRLFTYDDGLTDNGLQLGTMPAADNFVQTSIDHQVNLVNSNGLTLNFWDGPGHANDGAITGGSGVWRLSDNDHWTEADGAINAPYSEGAFAIFGGTGGTVTIDNANGPVSASGLQFVADGYTVTGGDLALTGGATSIRVGDGSAAGASMTATIDAAINGAGLLVKDDLGTLVLGGTNVYTGGTDVHGGTLQVSRDANLGNALGSLSIDDATLRTTASFSSQRVVGLGGDATIETDADTTLTLSGGMQGTGSLTKTGAGTLAVGGGATYAGATTVADGTLAATAVNAFNGASGFSVQQAGVLDLGGHAQQLASLVNAGTVAFGGTPGTTLSVTGDYAGQGGTLKFNTALGGDSSATDTLVVGGNTSGNTQVLVANVGGAGAQTSQGIKLIDVKGNSAGTFTLKGDYVFQGDQAVVAGAYAYRLYKGATDTADGDWYLRSALTNGDAGDPAGDPGNGPLYQPGVPVYEAYAGMLAQANTLDTLFQRTGNRQWADEQSRDAMQPGEGLWLRVQGADQTIKPANSTSGTNYDLSGAKSEVGADAVLAQGGDGKLVGSLSLQYGHESTSVRSAYGDGSINTHSYGVGGALTWYGDNDFYVDGQVHWMRFDSDLHSNELARVLADNNKATGYAFGVEAGKRFWLSDAWTITPQAQVSYGRTAFDGFNDAFDTRVSQADGKAGIARGGVTVDYLRTRQGAAGAVTTHLYAIANVYNHFKDQAVASVAGTDVGTRNERWWGGLGVGGALDWAGGRYSVYGEVQGQTGISDGSNSHGVSGTVGFRMRW
ncbi:autotransporter-associated beta strand repeat-containing protein [Luteibacter aegosomatissinici]|uniref:autotransporter-associated beta strand repeat-containing protein n=1 Tax=Luteibacter aegosomatissinici TaxID=2911539 RepID=UPI001FFB7FF1|nr:autotransporter-associated beta strand repeat-containing protein [Luteibacter aegosomatissinici]UPG96623.1 autotransporter outer membrane beta-barrel domain-containing protein [Luteibacter aegosomatissinici]